LIQSTENLLHVHCPTYLSPTAKKRNTISVSCKVVTDPEVLKCWRENAEKKKVEKEKKALNNTVDVKGVYDNDYN
jgi:hypothetical protein